MNTKEAIDTVLPLSTAISQGDADDRGRMPGEFTGKYPAGFEAVCARGREVGYRQGFNEGFAAAHRGHTAECSGDTSFRGIDSQKREPRKVLLGMPCEKCGVYLHREEMQCPSCGRPRKTTGPAICSARQ